MQKCLGCGFYFEPTSTSEYCPDCSGLGTKYTDNTYKIGLKEIKFCKYCGSKNIMPSQGIYKIYNCLECGSEFN